MKIDTTTSKFQTLKKRTAAPIQQSTTERLGKPISDIRNYSVLSAHELNLQVLISDELMNQILLRLQDDQRAEEGIEIIEATSNDLKDIIFNALIDLTQLRNLSITTAVSVIGYEGKKVK